MKVKLLKKIRARFKIVNSDGHLTLLDLKAKRIIYPIFDWSISARRNYKRYMFNFILGTKRYEKMRDRHAYRKFCNQQRSAFERANNT